MLNIRATADDFQYLRMADELESGLWVESVNGLQCRQAKDKIANGTLVDNKNIFHNFQAKKVLVSKVKCFDPSVRPASSPTNVESYPLCPPVLPVSRRQIPGRL